MQESKRVMGFEDYEIDIFGNVYSHKTGVKVFKKPAVKGMGYLYVDLYKNGKFKMFLISRLVATHFIPNPENKPEVNHKNGIKTDNSIGNLEWVTSSENKKHAFATGLSKLSDLNKRNVRASIVLSCSKPVAQYSLSGELIKVHSSQKEAERQTGVGQRNISTCVYGKAKTAGGYLWKNVN